MWVLCLRVTWKFLHPSQSATRPSFRGTPTSRCSSTQRAAVTTTRSSRSTPSILSGISCSPGHTRTAARNILVASQNRRSRRVFGRPSRSHVVCGDRSCALRHSCLSVRRCASGGGRALAHQLLESRTPRPTQLGVAAADRLEAADSTLRRTAQHAPS